MFFFVGKAFEEAPAGEAGDLFGEQALFVKPSPRRFWVVAGSAETCCRV
ncbi:MAG: hypothetical protein IPO00_17705 [Betaproteobacteria bacterium]|nr:hypothetical protein [Betaproteobacteria bacterium]